MGTQPLFIELRALRGTHKCEFMCPASAKGSRWSQRGGREADEYEWKLGTKEREKKKYHSKISLEGVYTKDVWEVTSGSDVHWWSATTDPDQSVSGTQYSKARAGIQVTRKSAHFINNVIFPLFLITLLSHVSMTVQPEMEGDRHQITLTMLLAVVAFKFVITQELPPVQTMTLV